MNKKQKRTRNRILLAIALFVVVYVVAELLPLSTWLGSETAALWAEFALFLVPYLIAGYDVLLRAAKNIGHGQVFDENFLMSVATIDVYKRQIVNPFVRERLNGGSDGTRYGGPRRRRRGGGSPALQPMRKVAAQPSRNAAVTRRTPHGSPASSCEPLHWMRAETRGRSLSLIHI